MTFRKYTGNWTETLNTIEKVYGVAVEIKTGENSKNPKENAVKVLQ